MHSQDRENYIHFQKTGAYEVAYELKKEGKIKHLGISFHDTAEVLEKTDAGLNEITHAVEMLNGISLKKKEEPGSDLDKESIKDGDFFESDGMKYQVVNAVLGTVKLVKGKDTANITVYTVSYKEKQYKVTEISARAFENCKKKLKKAVIGASVERIGGNAFKGCKKLKTVTVKGKSKLMKVGSGAFKKTSSKIQIKLPKNLKNHKKLKKQIKKAGISKIK